MFLIMCSTPIAPNVHLILRLLDAPENLMACAESKGGTLHHPLLKLSLGYTKNFHIYYNRGTSSELIFLTHYCHHS